MDYIKYRLLDCYEVLMRRKTTGHHYSKLGKILNLSDITQLSMGTALGVGPFVMVGRYTQLMGPGMVLAYVFAAAAAFLSALTYAELSCRGGGSGGAYTSIYQFVGEFPAAISGYLIVLQNLIGSALSTRALADMADHYTNKAISNWTKAHVVGFDTPLLAEYPSWLALIIAICTTVLNTFIIKEVATIHNFFVTLSLVLLILMIVVNGSITKWKYWSMPAGDNCGKGGFLPYGISSITDNCGLVFLAYLGFDAAPHAAAECREPERLIPLAMLVSNAVVTVLYILQAVTHTLVWNYCDQGDVSIVYVMQQRGINLMYWVTKIGIPLAIVGSIFATSFPLSRIIFAIAEDGLIYSFMAKINIHSRIPVNAVMTSGVLTGVVSLLLGEVELAELTCLASILSYGFIALNVIHLRHTDVQLEDDVKRSFFRTLLNMEPKLRYPSRTSSKIVSFSCILILIVSYPSFIFLRSIVWGTKDWFYVFLVALASHLVIYTIISRQPKSKQPLSFSAKPHNLVPFLCVIINIYMSLTMSIWTWARFGILVSLGLFMYLSYGVWNSKLNTIGDQYLY